LSHPGGAPTTGWITTFAGRRDPGIRPGRPTFYPGLTQKGAKIKQARGIDVVMKTRNGIFLRLLAGTTASGPLVFSPNRSECDGRFWPGLIFTLNRFEMACLIVDAGDAEGYRGTERVQFDFSVQEAA